MSNTSKSFIISQELCAELSQELGTLKRENILLKQSLCEQQTQAAATSEDLFLELLEVGDALENLLKLLDNPNLSPEFIARLPRNVGAVYRKFLNILAKRQVSQIETECIEGTQPDFTLCRVVEQEVVADIPEQSITKIVRQGFRCGEKVLRPVEVITSKK